MIFLFRFDIKEQGMDFVLNERIAADMYPEYERMLRPLVASTSQILEHYKIYSKSDTMMSGNFLDTNEFEVMLSKGLGNYIDPYTKNQILFENAKSIAEILGKVMNRRSIENR